MLALIFPMQRCDADGAKFNTCSTFSCKCPHWRGHSGISSASEAEMAIGKYLQISDHLSIKAIEALSGISSESPWPRTWGN
jgi:hypothetical protein